MAGKKKGIPRPDPVLTTGKKSRKRNGYYYTSPDRGVINKPILIKKKKNSLSFTPWVFNLD